MPRERNELVVIGLFSTLQLLDIFYRLLRTPTIEPATEPTPSELAAIRSDAANKLFHFILWLTVGGLFLSTAQQVASNFGLWANRGAQQRNEETPIPDIENQLRPD